MRKVLKWAGISLAILVVFVMVYSVLGKGETLALQIQPVDLAGIDDGDYTGSYDCYRWSNTVIVSVADHRIVDIQTVKGPSGREEIRRELCAGILREQTPALDAISGATADKKAFLKAVENALAHMD